MIAALQSELPPAADSIPGRPQEQLQIESPLPEDEIEYPKGAQLWLNMIAVMMVCFLHGLDLTIVAVAVPSYYSPFMYATAILGPVAAGILTTIDLNDSQLKVAAFLGLLGFAIGLGIQAPVTAAMTILSPRDASIGLGVLSFGAGIGSSLCIAASAALFHDRLNVEILTHAPGTNVSTIDSHGLGDLRNAIGPDRLKDVLFGYNEAVVQTLYVPLGLTLLAILGAAFTEVRSIKKKSE